MNLRERLTLTCYRTSFSLSLLRQMELGFSPAPRIVAFNSGIQELVTHNSCYKVTRTLSSVLHPAQAEAALPLAVVI
jgi:hypothetical protein